MKLRRVTLLAVMAALVLVLGASLTTAQDAKVIKIASQSPLSGPQSVLGTAIRNAAELAIEQMSGPLTEMGFTVEFVPFDDQATPDVGVANAQNMVNDPAILAVIGHLNSGVAIPSSEVYDANNLVMVSPANTNVNITDRFLPTVNRICGRDDAQGSAGAAFAASQGVTSVYVLHDNTAYGQGVAEFFQAEAERLGLTVLGFEGTSETANFDGIIQPILALSPEMIYFGGIYSQTAIFIQQARAAGYAGGFLGPDGFDSSEFAAIAGDAGVGTFYTTVAAPVTYFPDAAQFAADYEAKFGEAPQPFAAQSYDATGLVIKAIEIAAARSGGEVPSRALVASLVRATRDYQGITGTYSFDAVGDPVAAQYYILEVGSADPAAWNSNPLLQQVETASPLSAAAAGMAGS
ncbi:MAG: branched-chain amino acid ABC transporter substrate-binding protein [Anaerolineae bacterium]|jgi:branched-chain amino acid transport system substrate-binding protein|nr:branched-chain amino acid ABC transporter substrate-binding protein [Anaerolineae bacterium]